MSMTTPRVESALRTHYERRNRLERAAVDCEQLSRLCAALEGELPVEQASELSVHARSCPCCSVALDGGRDSGAHRGWVGGLAALAAAAALLLVLRPAQDPDTHAVGEVLQPKGGAVVATGDALHVGVRRGAEEWVAAPGDVLLAGDLVGFFTSAKADGYVLIVHVDSTMSVTPLVPADGTTSVAIEAGSRRPLEDSGLLTAADGRSWFVAVFSDAPVDLRTVADRLRGAEVDADGGLVVTLPGTRSVQILSVRRQPPP